MQNVLRLISKSDIDNEDSFSDLSITEYFLIEWKYATNMEFLYQSLTRIYNLEKFNPKQ